MVAVNCSHCAIVFPNISDLHDHIQKQVPDGSYTFDFKSQTGYPSETPFPFIGPPKFRKTRLLKGKDKTLTQKRKFNIRINDISTETCNPTLKIKEECDTEEVITDNDFGNLNVSDSSTGDLGDLQNDENERKDKTIDIKDKDNNSTESYITILKIKEESDIDTAPDHNGGNEIDYESITDDEYAEQFDYAQYHYNYTEETGINNTIEIQNDELLSKSGRKGKVKEAEKDPDFDPRGNNKKKRKKAIARKVIKKEKGPNLDPSGKVKKKKKAKVKNVNPELQKEKNPDIALSEKEADADIKEDVEHRVNGQPAQSTTGVVNKYPCNKRLYVPCSICGFFVQNYFLKKHEQVHQTEAGKKKYRPENLADCPTCNRRVLKSFMQRHICVQQYKPKPTKLERLRARKEKEKLKPKVKFPCHICGVLLKKTSMHVHLKSHTDTKLLECEICKKLYRTKAILQLHMDAAHGERIFQCDKCPKMFGHKSRLREHMVMHSEERPHICQVCGNAYRKRNHLNRHLLSHSEAPRISVCPHCGKNFNTSAIMRSHIIKVHENIRDYICSWPDCAKTFKGSTHLRRHMLLHLGEKPEKCDQCGDSFTQIALLHYHLQKKHNVDKMPKPSKANSCLGLPVANIRNPFHEDEPKFQTMKTIFFPSLKDQPFKDLVLEFKGSPLAYKPSKPVKSDLDTSNMEDSYVEELKETNLEDEDAAFHLLKEDTSRALLEDNDVSGIQTFSPVNLSMNLVETSPQFSMEQNQTDYGEAQTHVSDTGPVTMDSQYTSTQSSKTVIATSEDIFINC